MKLTKLPKVVYLWWEGKGQDRFLECSTDIIGCADVGERTHVGKYRLSDELIVKGDLTIQSSKKCR